VRKARPCAGPLNFHYLTIKYLGARKPAALLGSATLGTRTPRSTQRARSSNRNEKESFMEAAKAQNWAVGGKKGFL
jgi:hypothetical protein